MHALQHKAATIPSERVHSTRCRPNREHALEHQLLRPGRPAARAVRRNVVRCRARPSEHVGLWLRLYPQGSSAVSRDRSGGSLCESEARDPGLEARARWRDRSEHYQSTTCGCWILRRSGRRIGSSANPDGVKCGSSPRIGDCFGSTISSARRHADGLSGGSSVSGSTVQARLARRDIIPCESSSSVAGSSPDRVSRPAKALDRCHE